MSAAGGGGGRGAGGGGRANRERGGGVGPTPPLSSFLAHAPPSLPSLSPPLPFAGYALPKPLALAAVARWGLGPVSAIALAAGVALGAGWLCSELAALEALPAGAWRVGGRKKGGLGA